MVQVGFSEAYGSPPSRSCPAERRMSIRFVAIGPRNFFCGPDYAWNWLDSRGPVSVVGHPKGFSNGVFYESMYRDDSFSHSLQTGVRRSTCMYRTYGCRRWSTTCMPIIGLSHPRGIVGSLHLHLHVRNCTPSIYAVQAACYTCSLRSTHPDPSRFYIDLCRAAPAPFPHAGCLHCCPSLGRTCGRREWLQ